LARRPCNAVWSVTVGFGRDLHPVEPGRPLFVEDPLDTDLVSHPHSPLPSADEVVTHKWVIGGSSCRAASDSFQAEGSSVVLRRFGGEQVERDG
jgi:hypothetical protein